MFLNITIYWLTAYIIILFLFDISPGISFLITAKNTIDNKSFKIGFFTALGVAASDGLSAIIGFFFCSILSIYQPVFKYAQIVGMSYLLYFSIRMTLIEKKVFLLDNAPSTSRQVSDAYKSGFLYTSSNFGIAIVIISIISQFYSYVDNWYGYLLLFVCIPIISFLTFVFIVFSCYYLKLWWFFSKYAYVINKIVGFIIILLAITNVRSILGGL